MPLSYSARKKREIINPEQRNYASCIGFNTPVNVCSVTNIKFDSRPQNKLKILNQYLSQHTLKNSKIHIMSINPKSYSKYNNFKSTVTSKNPVLIYTQQPFSIDTQIKRNKNIVLYAERSLKKFPQRKVMSSMSYRNRKQIIQNKQKFSFPNPETQLFKNNEIMKKFTASSVFPKQNQISDNQRSLSEKKSRVKTNKLLLSNHFYYPLQNKNLTLIGGTQSIVINTKNCI